MSSAMPEAVRRLRSTTGAWSAARSALGAGALVTATGLALWTVTADPLAGGLLALTAFPGLALLGTAILSGRARLLAGALALLGGSAGIAVLVAGATADVAAMVGASTVAVLELARWSIERRTDPPAEDATERRRGHHLISVLLGGWLVGAVAVPFTAGGGPALGAWGPPAAALAAVAVVGAVAAAARSDRGSPG